MTRIVNFVVPSLDDPKAQLLAASVKAWAEVRQNQTVPKASYVDTPLMRVTLIPQAGATPLQCWFNVRDTVRELGGEAVFGWAIWRRHDSHYQAIHHAVWRKDSGEYVDVTPLGFGGDCTLFMADQRVPFDYAELRAPASLVMHEASTVVTGQYVWVDGDDKALPTYGLLRWNRQPG